MRAWLRSFFPRKWSVERSGEVEQFLDRWADRSFIDAELQAGYRTFYEALVELDRWMGDWGFSMDEKTVYVPKPDGEELLPGFYETTREGERLAKTVADRAAAFEQLGHRRGL